MADTLLRRSLVEMRNPFHFPSVAYPRSLWEEIEGYGGGRLINPDKDFHWRLLGVAERALFDPAQAHHELAPGVVRIERQQGVVEVEQTEAAVDHAALVRSPLKPERFA